MKLTQAFEAYSLQVNNFRTILEQTMTALGIKAIQRNSGYPRSIKLRNRVLWVPENLFNMIEFFEALLAAQNAGAKIEAVTKTQVGVGYKGEWFYLGSDPLTGANTEELFVEWWKDQQEKTV